MSISVLIPALKPSGQLLGVVSALTADPRVRQIILVNDGSPPAHDAIFAEASANPKVVFLKHAENLGKGAALRTGMNHFLCHTTTGVLVTADADGQHLPEDILAVGQRALDAPGVLVMGSRAFSGDVPFRSQFGNTLTRWVFRMVSGHKLTDTQTGLRAIPRTLMQELLHFRNNGYDFEMEMLVAASHRRVPIQQVRIATVYIENNRDSHFNPLLDSLRIYMVFVRHLLRTAQAQVVDFVVFLGVLLSGGGLLPAAISGRASACAWLLAGWKVRLRPASVVTRQTLWLLVTGVLSYYAVCFLVFNWAWRILPAKLLVEAALFLGTMGVRRLVAQTGATGSRSLAQKAGENVPT